MSDKAFFGSVGVDDTPNRTNSGLSNQKDCHRAALFTMILRSETSGFQTEQLSSESPF